MDFLDEKLQLYIEAHTIAESALLAKLNRETNLNVLQPRMLSGHLQGRVLSFLSKMIRPKRILEIGTYTGYSAICLAEGLQKDGKLYTIDLKDELEGMVRGYIKEANLEDKVEFILGNALAVIPKIDGYFDLVFIDADKENYLNYYKMIIDRLPQGGYVVADNVLWSGKVIESPEKGDTETRGIQDFNQFVHEDDRVENVLFPIRDGLMILRKK